MYITVPKAIAKSLEKGILICRPDSVLRPARKKKKKQEEFHMKLVV